MFLKPGTFLSGRNPATYLNIQATTLPNNAIDPFHPEVIIINLGTNDWSAPIVPSDYINRYRQLIKFIRDRYPSSELFCIIGPMNLSPSPYLTALVKELKDEGDAHIHFMEFPLIKRPEDGMGGSGHSSVKKHQHMAVQLSNKLKQLYKF